MQQFLYGTLTMGCCVAALLFLRFWYLTWDRLFLFFSLAFWSFALNWIALALAEPSLESRHYLFLLRLLGFIFIIWGILDKNKQRG
jgi:hypothetical protein